MLELIQIDPAYNGVAHIFAIAAAYIISKIYDRYFKSEEGIFFLSFFMEKLIQSKSYFMIWIGMLNWKKKLKQQFQKWKKKGKSNHFPGILIGSA